VVTGTVALGRAGRIPWDTAGIDDDGSIDLFAGNHGERDGDQYYNRE
jgi:hypothetical protein